MRISRAQDFPFNAVPATTWRTYLQYFAGALTVKTASLRLRDMVNAHGTEGETYAAVERCRRPFPLPMWGLRGKCRCLPSPSATRESEDRRRSFCRLANESFGQRPICERFHRPGKTQGTLPSRHPCCTGVQPALCSGVMAFVFAPRRPNWPDAVSQRVLYPASRPNFGAVIRPAWCVRTHSAV